MNFVEEIASKLSLDFAKTDRGFVVGRHGNEVEITCEPVESSPMDRSRAYHRLLGARYGFDRLSETFDYSIERPTGDEKPRNTYERRSQYGERLQRLVSRLTISWAEAISGDSLFATDWVFDDLGIIYVYEVGRIWHAWGKADFAKVEFDAENLEEFARLALFYESYKPRPREERNDWGRIRTYTSNEGLTASRALLLPDFDYDASQADGFFSVPSRDCMLIVEPTSGHREASLDVLIGETESAFETALLPFSNAVYELHRTEIGSVAKAGVSRPSAISDDTWQLT